MKGEAYPKHAPPFQASPNAGVIDPELHSTHLAIGCLQRSAAAHGGANQQPAKNDNPDPIPASNGNFD